LRSAAAARKADYTKHFANCLQPPQRHNQDAHSYKDHTLDDARFTEVLRPGSDERQRNDQANYLQFKRFEDH